MVQHTSCTLSRKWFHPSHHLVFLVLGCISVHILITVATGMTLFVTSFAYRLTMSILLVVLVVLLYMAWTSRGFEYLVQDAAEDRIYQAKKLAKESNDQTEV